jgi:TP901 family phage tail tape measure protein
MAIAAMRVPTVFTAIDRFSDVVTRMTAKTSAFGASAEAAAMRTSRSFNRAGTNMLTAGVGMAVGIGYAVNEAVKYEAALASLAAVTGTQVGAMNLQIESLGRETKRNVIDIAKSFEIVGSKMSQYLDNPEALKGITKASILMADASKMELEPAIESLTGVLNIFGKSASDANYIVNKLSAGEIVGSISIAETADVLRQFGGTARLANVQVDESIALIQTLTKSLGIEGVGRGIRNLMVDFNMVGVFDKNKTRALQKAGVDMDVLGNKSLDLVTRMRELKKLEGNSAAMGMFFKKTGIQTGATLFQNFDDYIRFLDLIKKTNAAQEQADKNNATMAKKMKDLKAQVSFLAITIGTALLPRIKDFVDSIMPVIQSISDWGQRNKGLANTLLTATKWLLILGVASKVTAFLFYGLAKAIAFVKWAQIAYTTVVELCTVATYLAAGGQATFAASLMAVAGGLLAAYWPVLLVVAALGGLAYAFSDTGDATTSMVDSQIASLSKGNMAWNNSTKVLKDNLNKQSNAIKQSENIKIPKSNVISPSAVSGLQNYLNKNGADITKAKFDQYQYEQSLINKPEYMSVKAQNVNANKLNPNAISTNTPQNLAGRNKSDLQEMKQFMQSKSGKLDLNVFSTKGLGVDVVGTAPSGIQVNTKQNQGQR